MRRYEIRPQGSDPLLGPVLRTCDDEQAREYYDRGFFVEPTPPTALERMVGEALAMLLLFGTVCLAGWLTSRGGR